MSIDWKCQQKYSIKVPWNWAILELVFTVLKLFYPEFEILPNFLIIYAFENHGILFQF